MAGIRRREAERNGLLFQADCGAGVDAVEDGIAEGEDLRCRGAAAVDDGEDVLGGEAGAAERAMATPLRWSTPQARSSRNFSASRTFS